MTEGSGSSAADATKENSATVIQWPSLFDYAYQLIASSADVASGELQYLVSTPAGQEAVEAAEFAFEHNITPVGIILGAVLGGLTEGPDGAARGIFGGLGAAYGSVALEAVVGAELGSTVGPIGTAAGAVVGGFVGLTLGTASYSLAKQFGSWLGEEAGDAFEAVADFAIRRTLLATSTTLWQTL